MAVTFKSAVIDKTNYAFHQLLAIPHQSHIPCARRCLGGIQYGVRLKQELAKLSPRPFSAFHDFRHQRRYEIPSWALQGAPVWLLPCSTGVCQVHLSDRVA